ncbi:MAG: AGE family epimerase/isomerase [Alphaproteobacteria bacterium]|nr:AGE family epimerase/isomerase [Alphaproteobacteria bacterium]|tara:strand:- start:2656 stop:3828 length:1173 start_codon:yes stop_codon:yes gene_type:complete
MGVNSHRITSWLFESALPLWSNSGLDVTAGGFFDSLSINGIPIKDENKRLRVQARQVYVYSHAYLMGWKPVSGGISPLEVAKHGFEFITSYYWRDEPGGFTYSVDRDGTIKDSRVELYEQAFAIFSFAWYYRATGDERAIEMAIRTLEFIDLYLKDAKYGGYYENLSKDLPRRQNSHMHLFEALLALFKSTGDSEFVDRAVSIYELLSSRFIDNKTNTLGEFFDYNWAPASGTSGLIVEPGHHYEWVWLLYQFESLGCITDRSLAEKLYQFAEKFGVEQTTEPTKGLIFDSVMRSGIDLDDNKRLWCQTESIKAQTARLELELDKTSETRLEFLLDRLFKLYLINDTGLWREHIARDGEPIRHSVPATSFYHLFIALTEVLRVRDGVDSI